ncbi:hypothetical protein QQS21_005648 [Conoideocrella luteorostrata]|uniref:Methyltransferase type 11 domain-containing protein n=1 Tax=Conoideocrella luteorostrata TaxID=1105319 RepID=A0AAJ0CP79_9HYPO|nr:hypothetical protein QQS21_005648 [Conoideocrella luteorostrata]
MDKHGKNDHVFWKLHNIEATYWDEYITTRPVYDDAVFSHVYAYQAAHSQSRLAALDIGSGSGSAVGPLTEQFAHVVASDNDNTSLDFARRRYSKLPLERLSFILSRGEDLMQHFPPSYFDLITCAEAFPLMDTHIAMNNAATLLRPGGTLAVWFYGPPFFTEASFATACQPLLDSIMDLNFYPVVSGGDDAQKKSWKRATDGMLSWLDYIPFAPEQWHNVRRHKWNTAARLSFFTPRICDFAVEPVSMVGTHETVLEEQDPTFWEVRWDVSMLKRFVKASFPKPRELVGPDAAMEKLFEQLTEAMGDEGAMRALSWPVVLILAARRE